MHVSVFVTLVCLSFAWLAFELGRFAARQACVEQKGTPVIEYRFIPRTLDEELALPSEALAVLRSLT